MARHENMMVTRVECCFDDSGEDRSRPTSSPLPMATVLEMSVPIKPFPVPGANGGDGRQRGDDCYTHEERIPEAKVSTRICSSEFKDNGEGEVKGAKGDGDGSILLPRASEGASE